MNLQTYKKDAIPLESRLKDTQFIQNNADPPTCHNSDILLFPAFQPKYPVVILLVAKEQEDKTLGLGTFLHTYSECSERDFRF